ncbi:MAG TPA: molybdopterin-guanine dinucleotide biosynthesis protein B [Vulgatibacter sp.]|nr:molybdopterin-guanine dinucleotide biosynthesis protein B [Vulgatibacter sp.]
MISLDEAHALVAAHLAPLPPSDRAPGDALGCRLAAPLVARGALPTCDDSAMDGWAIRAERVAGASRQSPVWLSPQEARPIATGDPIPAGADAVLPLELARQEGDRVGALLPVPRGANIRRVGEDVAAGAVLFPAGALIDATVALAAASLGERTIPVRPRLRAAVLPVGSHVASGRPDATGIAIHAALDGLHVASALLEPAGADAAEVAERIRSASRGVDLLVTAGAASVGANDVVPAALARLEATRVFHGVSIKPGKPVGLWRLGDAAILVLPGSPSAALACFDSIGRAVCARLAGAPPPAPIHAAAGRAIERRRGKTGLLRGRLVSTPAGLQFFASPKQGPSQVSAVADTNALALIPPQVEAIASGDPLRVLPLGEIPAEESGPRAVAICGLSGAGKTWLVERLLARLSEKGVRAATVKNDAHGFDPDPPGKDTARHRAAGAVATILVGPSRTASVREGALALEEAVRRAAIEAEVVLVEGFKSDRTLPKIEVAARGRERVHAAPLLALVTDRDQPDAGAPVFGTGEADLDALCDVVLGACRTGSPSRSTWTRAL